MKKAGVSVIGVLLVVILTGCSSGEDMTNGTMTGSWAMTLANSSGVETLKANVDMTERTGGMMSMEKMDFTMPSPCFGPDHFMEGQMSNMQDMIGNRMNMDMTIHMWSLPNKSGNHMEMKMTMNSGMNGGSGTYILTGITTECQSETGTVVMSRSVN